MHTIGIDFGTTKTLVSRIVEEIARPETVRLGQGTDHIPTSVFIKDNGDMLFGDEADDRLTEADGVYLRGFKMSLGNSTPVYVQMNDEGELVQYMAAELVTRYLSYIRTRVQETVFSGEPITRAIITRPVEFSPARCEELRQAAIAAGFTEVELTTEPEAAGLAFCSLNDAQAFRHSALIVDWGGGTLDFALVTREENSIITHPNLTAGDITMGGERFDHLLWSYAENQLRKHAIFNVNPVDMLPIVRKNKERLSASDTATLRLSHEHGTCPPIELTQQLFNRLINDSVERAADKIMQLLERIPEADKPEMLLLVGGSCRIPYIKRKLEEVCKLPTVAWHLSREAVSLGAALWDSQASPATLAKPLPPATTETDAVSTSVTPAPPTSPARKHMLGKVVTLGVLLASATSAPFIYSYFNQEANATKQADAEALFNLGVRYENGEGVDKDLEEAVKWYRLAADQGHAEAQYKLGVCYEKGEGVNKNAAEAVKWYQLAADQGYAWAQYNLGVCYYNGEGVNKNAAEAVKWFRLAAEQGLAEAQYNLGICYINGEGVKKDDAEAVKWFRLAAEQGLAQAQFNLSSCYYNGEGVNKDAAEAVKWYRKAAEQGLAMAQFNLGFCYDNGWGVNKNATEAVKWYRKAAEQGLAMAQNNLGECYTYGEGVKKDTAEAVKWYRKAAEQGLAEAQCTLGVCYENGEGVKKDAAEAVKWYRKAAEQGHTAAQYNLGVCYYNGEGVNKDAAEAVKWFQLAAEQGDADAQYNLGYCYENGVGVNKDTAEAVKWYRKAAEQGLAVAQSNLGYCYQYGVGVNKDAAEAVKWYREAAAQGFKPAEEALKNL